MGFLAKLLTNATEAFLFKYGGRFSELEAKYLLLLLFAMGGLAVWSGSEAVLPACIIGMVLAGTVGKQHGVQQDDQSLLLFRVRE